MGRNVGGAARGGSLTLGGGGLVKAGSGRFGNLALVSDRPPAVCVPRLTERRLSRRYSDFFLGLVTSHIITSHVNLLLKFIPSAQVGQIKVE